MVMTETNLKDACVTCPTKATCPLVDEVTDTDHVWVDISEKIDIHDQVGEYS